MYKLIFIVVFIPFLGVSQDTLSLLFAGDIMGHDAQIISARKGDGSYDYSEVFKYIEPVVSGVDLAIANLEVTLAGEPFKGYPQFSSPDELAEAVKNAGFDILGTANNHAADRRTKGIIRTIKVLDSLEIAHTGTFISKEEREERYPLVINKNGFKLAFLNYTYGTNGVSVKPPVIVNRIDTAIISKDIEKAKSNNPDLVILFIHWGTEYQHKPSTEQIKLAEYCFSRGVDYIIGSHPHVIQKSEWIKSNTKEKERFITYSLGNYVSNQSKRYTDGGQMIKMVVVKSDTSVNIIEAGYFLTWVYMPEINCDKHYYILPCAEFEMNSDFFVKGYYSKMKMFISDSRSLLRSENSDVGEYLYYKGEWVSP